MVSVLSILNFSYFFFMKFYVWFGLYNICHVLLIPSFPQHQSAVYIIWTGKNGLDLPCLTARPSLYYLLTSPPGKQEVWGKVLKLKLETGNIFFCITGQVWWAGCPLQLCNVENLWIYTHSCILLKSSQLPQRKESLDYRTLEVIKVNKSLWMLKAHMNKNQT